MNLRIIMLGQKKSVLEENKSTVKKKNRSMIALGDRGGDLRLTEKGVWGTFWMDILDRVEGYTIYVYDKTQKKFTIMICFTPYTFDSKTNELWLMYACFSVEIWSICSLIFNIWKNMMD